MKYSMKPVCHATTKICLNFYTHTAMHEMKLVPSCNVVREDVMLAGPSAQSPCFDKLK